jgi:hypothetical protein
MRAHPGAINEQAARRQGATADHPRPNGCWSLPGSGDYESAIIAYAFCGFAMGATASAVPLPPTKLTRFAKHSAERRGANAI